MRSDSDPERLLREAQTGDPDWEAVFVVVRAPMRRAARSAMLTMGVDDVSAVDDAFVLGFRRLEKYGLVGRRSLIGFARSVAYFAGQDTARKMIGDREFAPDEPVPDEIVDRQPTPEDLVVIGEEEEAAQAMIERRYAAAIICLETLTPGQREAVVEVEMGSKSDSQLAEEMGVSHTAIWKRRTKGLDKLRSCVRARLDGNDVETGPLTEGTEIGDERTK